MPDDRSSAASAPRGRQQQRRQRTETRIIEAFGRIVVRDGLYGVRVNHLMREAGVGKRQLYQYFGGLAGVAAAWSRAGMKTPGPIPSAVTVDPGLAPDSPAAKLSMVLFSYAEALRRNPNAAAALLGQLDGPPEMAEPFRQVREALRREQLDAFVADARLRQGEYVALYSVLYAAINYVALRARFAPAFNGLDLTTDLGWNELMAMFRSVVAAFERGLAGAGGSRSSAAGVAQLPGPAQETTPPRPGGTPDEV